MAIGTKAYLIVGMTAAGLGVALCTNLFISGERPQVMVGWGEPIASRVGAECSPALLDFGNSLSLVSKKVETDESESTLSDFVPRTFVDSRIADALQSTTEVNFTDVPLKDGLDYLKELHHIEFWIDQRSMEEEGISLDQTCTLSKSGVQLRSVLNLMLEPLGLKYFVANETLVITTKQVAETTFETRVYDVSKITQEIPTKELVELVIGAGTDQMWKKVDGEGGSIFATKSALVIRQNYQGHEEIIRLLIQLERLAKHNDNKPKDPSAVPAKSI